MVKCAQKANSTVYSTKVSQSAQGKFHGFRRDVGIVRLPYHSPYHSPPVDVEELAPTARTVGEIQQSSEVM